MTFMGCNPYYRMQAARRGLEERLRRRWERAPRSADQGGEECSWSPDLDVVEEPGKYRIDLELPGVAKEDVTVTVTQGLLKISGRKKPENSADSANTLRRERVFGSFCRTFRLPEQVRAEHIQAEFRAGVLSLTLPKAEAAKPREVPIA